MKHRAQRTPGLRLCNISVLPASTVSLEAFSIHFWARYNRTSLYRHKSQGPSPHGENPSFPLLADGCQRTAGPWYPPDTGAFEDHCPGQVWFRSLAEHFLCTTAARNGSPQKPPRWQRGRAAVCCSGCATLSPGMCLAFPPDPNPALLIPHFFTADGAFRALHSSDEHPVRFRQRVPENR